MIAESLRYLRKPAWIGLVLLATVASAGAALWMGMQRQPEQTATTFVFGRRVGYLDRPVPVLDEHIDEIVNSVEFPGVFFAIRDRTLLEPDRDYEFTIERLEDEESVVEIAVVAGQAGDAERISRILVEEMVAFVLDGQQASVTSEIGDIDQSIRTLEASQQAIRDQSFGISPEVAVRQIELGLIRMDENSTLDDDQLRDLLIELRPLEARYLDNIVELNALYRDRAARVTEQSDLVAALENVNADWYRLRTPVEAASNVPVAIAMAFTAGVPAVLVAMLLVTLTLNLRLTGRLIPRTDGRRPQLA